MNILALDVGLKRIGVALSISGIAMPLDAVIRTNRQKAAEQIKELVKAHKIELLLVGIPMGGASENEMRRRIEHFVGLVGFDNVKYVDESYTSKNAQKLIGSKKKDGKQDSMAAYLMLKDYCDVLC